MVSAVARALVSAVVLFLSQGTFLHIVSLHPGVNGYRRQNPGGNPAMDLYSIQEGGSSNTPSCSFMLRKSG